MLSNMTMIYLAPYPRSVEGGGLFLKHGNDISAGLMGKNIQFVVII